MKAIFCADLHAELLSRREMIDFRDELVALAPDLLFFAGDVAAGSCWPQVLSEYVSVAPAGRSYVIAGNHDIWVGNDDRAGPGYYRPPIMKFDKQLPQEAGETGWIWAEEEILRFNRTAVVCSIAWYDYEAAPEPRHVHAAKEKFSNDFQFIDCATGRGEWNDLEFARNRNASVVRRLKECEEDSTIDDVIVVTHVPVFLEQKVDSRIDVPAIDGLYFNLSLGREIKRFAKVTNVISGHTHRGISAVVERENGSIINAAVIGSDYQAPVYLEMKIGR